MQSYASEIDWLKSRVDENSASMLYARLADRYLQINELDRAIEFAEKGVLVHPHYATARYVLAKCYFENSQFDEANKHLKEALVADPQFLGALNLQSELSNRMSDLDQVKQNYSQILTIDPANNDVVQKLQQLETAASAPEPDFEAPEQSTLEPDGFLESSVGAAADFDSQLSRENEDVIPESPLQDMESEAQNLFEAPAAESTSDDDFSALLGETPSTQTNSEANPFEGFDEPAGEDDVAVEPEAPDEEEGATNAQDAQIRDKVLDESIDDEFEIDRSKYREEESRFTELLDNIFSSSIDEEEQAESEIRSAIERMANEDSGDSQTTDKTKASPPRKNGSDQFAPLMPPDEGPSHEEQIIESAKDDEEDFMNIGSDLDVGAEEENSIPDEFITQEDKPKDDQDAVIEQDIVPPFEEAPSTAESEPPVDFSDFISSLDINEDVEAKEKDESFSLDNDLPSFDLDLDDDVVPALHSTPEPESANDDWTGFLSEDEKSSPVDATSAPIDQTDAPATPPEQQDTSGSPPSSAQPDAAEATPTTGAEKEESAGEGRNKGKFYTPTLGEIYAAQGQYSKAISVFETLIKSNPENEMYQQKLDYLRRKLDEQQQGL